MKIDINNIPPQGGLIIEKEIGASTLDLETDLIRFLKPLKVKADLSRIINTVTVDLILNTSIQTNCSRCLNEIDIDFNKNLKLHYPVNKLKPVIELDSDMRDEIVLDYPVKPLCNPNCKGLCPKCGKNLNEGGCSCATT